jgi:hypothetical protein
MGGNHQCETAAHVGDRGDPADHRKISSRGDADAEHADECQQARSLRRAQELEAERRLPDQRVGDPQSDDAMDDRAIALPAAGAAVALEQPERRVEQGRERSGDGGDQLAIADGAEDEGAPQHDQRSSHQGDVPRCEPRSAALLVRRNPSLDPPRGRSARRRIRSRHGGLRLEPGQSPLNLVEPTLQLAELLANRLEVAPHIAFLEARRRVAPEPALPGRPDIEQSPCRRVQPLEPPGGRFGPAPREQHRNAPLRLGSWGATVQRVESPQPRPQRTSGTWVAQVRCAFWGRKELRGWNGSAPR